MNEWAAVFMVLAMVGIPAALIAGFVFWLKGKFSRNNALKKGFLDLPRLQWHAFSQVEGSPSFRFTPETKSRNSTKPSRMEVTLSAQIPCDLKTRKMTRADQWGLRFGLGRTLVTGDPIFDAVVYVEATSEGFAGDLLGKKEARESLVQLVRVGFTGVTWQAKTGRITTTWCGYSLEPARDIMAVGEAIQGLELLRDFGPCLEAGSLPDWKLRNNLGFCWSITWAVILVFCMASGFFLG